MNGSELRHCRTLPTGSSLSSKLVSVKVYRGLNETVRSFPGDRVITIEIPTTSSAPSASNVCKFWDPVSGAFETDGCETVSSGGNVTVCSCSHLTEFAVVARQREESGDGGKKLLWIYVAGALAYGFLAGVASYQLFRLAAAGKCKGFFSPAKSSARTKNVASKWILIHIAILLLCMFRIISSVLLSRAIESFTVNSIHPGLLMVLLALPYTFLFWIFSYVAFQWIAIVHNTKLSRTPFEKVKRIYICVNVGAVVVSWALLGYMAFQGTAEDAVLSCIGLAVLFIVLAGGVFIYGQRLSIMLIRLQKKGKSAGTVSALRKRAIGAGFGHIFQGVMLIISSILIQDDDVMLIATLLYMLSEAGNLGSVILLYWSAVQREVAPSALSSGRSATVKKTKRSRFKGRNRKSTEKSGMMKGESKSGVNAAGEIGISKKDSPRRSPSASGLLNSVASARSPTAFSMRNPAHSTTRLLHSPSSANTRGSDASFKNLKTRTTSSGKRIGSEGTSKEVNIFGDRTRTSRAAISGSRKPAELRFQKLSRGSSEIETTVVGTIPRIVGSDQVELAPISNTSATGNNQSDNRIPTAEERRKGSTNSRRQRMVSRVSSQATQLGSTGPTSFPRVSSRLEASGKTADKVSEGEEKEMKKFSRVSIIEEEGGGGGGELLELPPRVIV